MYKVLSTALVILLLFVWSSKLVGSDIDRSKSVSSLGKIIELERPIPLKSAAGCSMQKHNDTATGFFSGFVLDDRLVTYFDPAAECGSPAFPFEIQAISFTLFDAGGYQWPVDIDVVVYDMLGADSCAGPGDELCRFTVQCDSSLFAIPNVASVSFPFNCCIDGPFYVGLEYSDTGSGTFPSIVFDNSAPVPACENWGFWSGSWFEWYDYWTAPEPGYPIIWVDGETQSSTCASRIVINEVQAYPFAQIQNRQEYSYAFIELYNAGAFSSSISSWDLRKADGTSIASLPSVILKPGDFFTVNFGIGTDDLDLTDGVGSYYTNGDSVVFLTTSDGVALHIGPSPGDIIIDATFWSRDGSTPSGASYSDAVAAGLWSSGDYFDIDSTHQFSTYGLCADGADHDISTDWREFGWGEYALSWTGPQNPLQISPPNGGLLDQYAHVLTWGNRPFADSFLVEVDTNPSFLSPAILSTTTDTTMSASALADGIYYWRVRVFEGVFLSLPYATYEFLKDATAKSGGTSRVSIQLGVARQIQHKDTRLLCIYEHPAGQRPGCAEMAGANGPWDNAHATAAAHVLGCEHCSWYCTRAVIAMINNYFGGDLSQDRISYELFFDDDPGPEADLGHNYGTLPGSSGGAHGLGERWQIYEWAIGTAVTRRAGKPPFDTIKAHIDAGRPIFIDGQAHSTLVYGYYYDNPMGPNPIPAVYIHNPWPGTSGFSTYNTWTPDGAGWGNGGYFVIPDGYDSSNAINQEAAVTLDTDGDGVMDFDEKVVRDFHSVHNDKDTEDDQIEDKDEIRNYTFHDQAGYHPGHENDALNFPDIDGDGLRAENDCDSDNDSDFDGGEDINGDGHNPVPSAGNVCNRETCQFDLDEFCIKVAVDKDVYLLGEPVYIVDQHYTRETHTYHENSTYNYEKGAGCPTKADSSALAHNGSFTTDAGGHAIQTFVEYCLTPGDNYLTVDILDDYLYSTPDNLDPQTCWTCAEDWFHGFHWGYDYTFHNLDANYPGYDYPGTYFEPTIDPSYVTYTIVCPWWWWCYEWPPITDNYWLGVGLPADLVEAGIITMELTDPPLLVEPTENDSGTVYNAFIPTEIVQMDLTSTFPGSNLQWFGFEIPNWQLPDSQVATRINLKVKIGEKIIASSTIKIMVGDSVFGWSPTPYDSIPITVLSGGCCVGNRGDFNDDGDDAGILDLTYLVDFIFRGGGPSACPGEADINGDGTVSNILDLTFLVDFIFRGGVPPGPC